MDKDINKKLESASEDEIPETIEVPTWFKSGGGMMYNRWCLDPDDPEHAYWYIWREYGISPELYGIENPMGGMKRVNCPCCGHSFIDRE